MTETEAILTGANPTRDDTIDCPRLTAALHREFNHVSRSEYKTSDGRILKYAYDVCDLGDGLVIALEEYRPIERSTFIGGFFGRMALTLTRDGQLHDRLARVDVDGADVGWGAGDDPFLNVAQVRVQYANGDSAAARAVATMVNLAARLADDWTEDMREPVAEYIADYVAERAAKRAKLAEQREQDRARFNSIPREGTRVRVTLVGGRVFTGTLNGLDEDQLVFDVDGKTIRMREVTRLEYKDGARYRTIIEREQTTVA